MKTDTPVNDGANCGQSADSADNLRTKKKPACQWRINIGEPCGLPSTVKWGDGWFCNEHASGRAKTPSPASQDAAGDARTRTHELKTDPIVFNRVRSGEKTYEIRRDDREYAVGDFLLLRKTRHTGLAMAEGSPLIYTGDTCLVCVTHILRGPVYGLSEGWVIMSIRHITDTPMMPTPASYGEPWRSGDDFILNSDGEKLSYHEADCGEMARAVQCVNACQGIADPVEALKQARDILQDVDAYILNSKATPDAFDPAGMLSIRIHYALAKLNPA